MVQMVLVNCCAVEDHKKGSFVGRCSTGISQVGQGIFCIAAILVLRFHTTQWRNGVVLDKGAWQDSHGSHPMCQEASLDKDDSSYYQVLESSMAWQDLMALFRQAIIHRLPFSFSFLFLS